MKDQELENKDNFLARWLAEDISVEEMEQFKLSPNFSQYSNIVDGISKLKIKAYPEAVAYKEFKEELKAHSTIAHNDNFLGRWLDNSMAAEELEIFKKSKDYKIYTSITEGLSKLQTTPYSADLAYAEFKEKLNAQSVKTETTERTTATKVIQLPVLKLVGLAASFLLLLSIGYYANNVTIQTQVAQMENIVLPDNSKVVLNANSELTYNKVMFPFFRKLGLTGEAFFEVEKGSKFSVQSDNAKVQVLGTKFNVIARNDYFETTCFEGKVSVSKASHDDILTKGHQIRYINDRKENNTGLLMESSPKWLRGISEYKSTPIKYVLEALEAQFEISFDLSGLENQEALYSGQFEHANLDKALETVLLPMGIRYEKKVDTIILQTE